MDEVEMLNTHSMRRIRKMERREKILNAIGWISVLGIIAAGCYWLVNL